MGPALVVVDEPGIEIGLQLVDRAIDLLAERHPIEFVEHGAMGARRYHWFAGSWSWCGCGRYPRPPGRAHIRGSRGRKIRCPGRSAPGITGCRARRRTAPRGR